MVTVNSGPVDSSDSPKDWPQEKWDLLVGAWYGFVQREFPHDCRELHRYINEAEEYEVWKVCGYESLEDFINQGLGLEPEQVNWAMEGLQIYGMDAPVAMSKAAEIGRLKEQNPGITQQQIADKLCVSQKQVSRIVDPKGLSVKNRNTRQFGWMPVKPEDAAAKIREKFGDEFADALKLNL